MKIVRRAEGQQISQQITSALFNFGIGSITKIQRLFQQIPQKKKKTGPHFSRHQKNRSVKHNT